MNERKLTGELVLYDTACRALAKAHRVDEVKDIRDKAIAMQAYARQAKNTTLITQATEIRMRTERRAGELLIEMAERDERPRGRKKESHVATLSDLGVNKTQSSRLQKLALVPPEKFERNVRRAGSDAYNRMTARFVKETDIEQAQRRHQRAIEDGCTVADLVALADSGYRAAVIYADPAWPWVSFGPLGRTRSCPDHHYGLSSFAEIKALPVARLAADHCTLLLWATWPRLPEVLNVITAWDFVYQTCGFNWLKQTPSGDGLHTGMGYHTRSNSEVCLLATKGAPMRLATDVHQVVLAPVGEHSAKPEVVRRRIERLLGGPYLELYGRKPVPGWTVWGNEIERGQLGEDRGAPSEGRAENEKGRLAIPAPRTKSGCSGQGEQQA